MNVLANVLVIAVSVFGKIRIKSKKKRFPRMYEISALILILVETGI
jgi:hypothetical protein